MRKSVLWLSEEGGGAKANQNEKLYGKEEWNKMCKKPKFKEITQDGKDRKKKLREEKAVKMDREHHYFKNWIEYTIQYPHCSNYTNILKNNLNTSPMTLWQLVEKKATC